MKKILLIVAVALSVFTGMCQDFQWGKGNLIETGSVTNCGILPTNYVEIVTNTFSDFIFREPGNIEILTSVPLILRDGDKGVTGWMVVVRMNPKNSHGGSFGRECYGLYITTQGKTFPYTVKKEQGVFTIWHIFMEIDYFHPGYHDDLIGDNVNSVMTPMKLN